MLEDGYGNILSTDSQAARDAYVDGVERFLAAEHGAEAAFRRAVEADGAFALGHVGIARCRLLMGDRPGAATAIAAARGASAGLSAREAAHVGAIGHMVDGDVPAAYGAIRAHVQDYPRDAMIAQTCTGVFGLIGFSGRAGREAEQLAFTTTLAPAYGDDWWFLGQHAFAQGEVGQLEAARDTIERALDGNPRSAHNAHVSAHVFYETGDTDRGYRYLREWWPDYDRGGALHGHTSWHLALWALVEGDAEAAWRYLDGNCTPAGSGAPPLNILTDTVAFLHRANLSGIEVPAARWHEISAYASTTFPNAGLAFADVHSALAHCMAGDADAFGRLTREPVGPAGEIVIPVCAAFQAFANQDWLGVEENLCAVMSGHERLGGSRAQRDLLEFTLAHAVRQQGRHKEADRLIAMRRPRQRKLAAA